MAPLTLRRSSPDSFEPLSVVALAITYAVLTIALATEWGRIVQAFASGVGPNDDAAPRALVVTNATGDLP